VVASRASSAGDNKDFNGAASKAGSNVVASRVSNAAARSRVGVMAAGRPVQRRTVLWHRRPVK